MPLPTNSCGEPEIDEGAPAGLRPTAHEDAGLCNGQCDHRRVAIGGSRLWEVDKSALKEEQYPAQAQIHNSYATHQYAKRTPHGNQQPGWILTSRSAHSMLSTEVEWERRLLMSQVTFSIPDEILLALKATPEILAARIRIAAAVKLYEMGQLSSGAASQLAGVPKPYFLGHLADYGVSTFDLSEEELIHDLKSA